jgi:hypothetical protein
MRACTFQYVHDGEIYCEGNLQPCDDGMRFMNDDPSTKVLMGCADIDEPDHGARWQGVL